MDLSCEYVGLKLKNPLIIASSGLTETTERITKAENYGAAAVVVKSFFEEAVCRRSPTPHFQIINRKMGRLTSGTFYSFEQASSMDEKEYFREVQKAIKTVSIPVIPSINCLTEEGWIRCSKSAQEVGAPALELNVSCPHGSISFRGGDVEEKILHVARLVRRTVHIPLIVKLPMQLSSPLSMAKMLENVGINGVVMFNRLTGLDIDIENEKPIMHGGYAGHGGPWTFNYTLRWIATCSPHLNISIAASGGVGSCDDIVKYIYAGANVVEVCSLVYLEGYEVIEKLVVELKEFLRKKNYHSFSEIRGKISGKVIKGNDEIDRRKLYIARIQSSLCTACGICKKICIYNAPRKDVKIYIIQDEFCVGCGLCVQLCPVKAIELVPWSESS